MRRIRRRTRIRSRRAALLLKRAAAILVCALLVRLVFSSGLAGTAEQGLRNTGVNPDAAKTVLSFELPGGYGAAAPVFGWQQFLAGQSALFAAYGQAVPVIADMPEESWLLPPLSIPEESPAEVISPAPSAPAVSAPPAASPSPSPSPPDKVITAIMVAPNSPAGYDYYNGVYIKNQTSFTIDVDTALKNEPSVSLSSKGPQVLVIHSHGSEAYHPEGEDIYKPSDPDRTEDKNYSVIRVGNEITKILEGKGIKVIHDENLYDYPSYAGCYTRALEAIAVQLKKNPTIQVVIDVHRDSMTASDGSTYKTVANINGVQTAQVMLVMGTGQSGLSFPNWKDNLRLAVRVQKQMTVKYPGLARPINLRKERFNEHATPGSMLIEIGTSGNSLQEALAGARLFAEACGDVLAKYKK